MELPNVCPARQPCLGKSRARWLPIGLRPSGFGLHAGGIHGSWLRWPVAAAGVLAGFAAAQTGVRARARTGLVLSRSCRLSLTRAPLQEPDEERDETGHGRTDRPRTETPTSEGRNEDRPSPCEVKQTLPSSPRAQTRRFGPSPGARPPTLRPSSGVRQPTLRPSSCRTAANPAVISRRMADASSISRRSKRSPMRPTFRLSTPFVRDSRGRRGRRLLPARGVAARLAARDSFPLRHSVRSS